VYNLLLPVCFFKGMTRDLDAMGLMTQVKKGDDVRQKKHNARQGGSGNTAAP